MEKVSDKLKNSKEEEMGNTVVDVITRDITLTGKLDDTQRDRLLEIANKCPVHKTLESHPRMLTRLNA